MKTSRGESPRREPHADGQRHPAKPRPTSQPSPAQPSLDQFGPPSLAGLGQASKYPSQAPKGLIRPIGGIIRALRALWPLRALKGPVGELEMVLNGAIRPLKAL